MCVILYPVQLQKTKTNKQKTENKQIKDNLEPYKNVQVVLRMLGVKETRTKKRSNKTEY